MTFKPSNNSSTGNHACFGCAARLGRRTHFFALKLLTAQRSNEGSRAALAPGAVRLKEMHRVAMPERVASDWPNGRVGDIQASLTRRRRLAAGLTVG